MGAMRGCLLVVIGILIGALAGVWLSREPAIRKGIVVPQRAELHVVISDGYLSTLVNRRLRNSSASVVHDVRVSSKPPSVLTAIGTASVGPLSTSVAADLQPEASNGGVHVSVVATHVGAIPIPSAFTGLFEGSIDDAIRRSLGGRVRVVAVDVRAEGLEIYADHR
jgi:hypothetical protein